VEAAEGIDLPHIHIVPGELPQGSEVGGLIPGRRLRPDSYRPEQREVWFYHGDWYHGFPPGHRKHESFIVGDQWGPDVYTATMKMMQLFVDQGMSVKYTWETEFLRIGMAAIVTLTPGGSSSSSSMG